MNVIQSKLDTNVISQLKNYVITYMQHVLFAYYFKTNTANR